MKTNTYYLEARYDSRASFYNKATVNETAKTLTLISYETTVAIFDKVTKVLRVLDIGKKLTTTTKRHIREFALQNNINISNVNEGEYK